MATLRLVRAAERAGAKRFVFFSALGAAPPLAHALLPRQGAGRGGRQGSRLETTVFSPSIVYTPGDPWLTLLERLSYLPAVPVSGSGDALFQPIWAEDVADCVMAALNGDRRGERRRAGRSADALLRRHRACGPARARPAPAPAARAAAAGPRVAAAASLRRRPPRVRHLGRGRADGGADDDAARQRRRRGARRPAAADGARARAA